MTESCDGALGGDVVLNGAGAGEGLSEAEAVAPLPVFTHALVDVLAGVPHQDLTAALSLPVAACCSLFEALVSSSLRAVAILLLCCLSSVSLPGKLVGPARPSPGRLGMVDWQGLWQVHGGQCG